VTVSVFAADVGSVQGYRSLGSALGVIIVIAIVVVIFGGSGPTQGV
jgi:hypothetical protein